MSAALLVKGVKLLAALGVTKVVTDVIKTNTITNNIIQRVMVNVGGFVIGSMVMDQASKHVNDGIAAIRAIFEEEKQKRSDNEPKQ